MARKTMKTFPGLSRDGDIKIRHELYDQDYIKKLSPQDRLLAI